MLSNREKIILKALGNRSFYNKCNPYLKILYDSSSDDFKKYLKAISFFYKKYQEKDFPLHSLDVDLNNIDVDYDYVFDTIQKFVRKKLLLNVIYDAFSKVEPKDDHEIDDDTLVSIENKIKEIINFTSSLSDDNILNYNSSIYERYNKVNDYLKEFFPTGIEIIDNALRGGLRRKELSFIAAPSKGGKTWLLCYIAANLFLRGYKVYYYTLELNKYIVSLRIDQCIIKNSFEELMKNIEKLKKIVSMASAEGGMLKIVEFPARTLTVSEMKSQLQNEKFDVLIIDYADLLKSNRYNKDSRYIEQGDIYVMLRSLATELNISILTATQTNRSGFSSNDVSADHIADSIDKVRHADACFFVSSKQLQDGKNVLSFNSLLRNHYGGKLGEIIFDFTRGKIESFTEENL